MFNDFYTHTSSISAAEQISEIEPEGVDTLQKSSKRSRFYLLFIQ
jgi:hypothetical protein